MSYAIQGIGVTEKGKQVKVYLCDMIMLVVAGADCQFPWSRQLADAIRYDTRADAEKEIEDIYEHGCILRGYLKAVRVRG